MNIWARNILLSLVATCVLVSWWGIYYATYEATTAKFISGELIGEPVESMFLVGFILLDRLFYFLYSNFPAIDFYLGYHLVSLALGSAVIGVFTGLVFRPKSPVVFGLVVLALQVVVFSENFLRLNINQHIFYLTLLPLLFLLHSCRLREKGPHRFLIVAVYGCIVLGTLLRVETASLSIFLYCSMLLFMRKELPRPRWAVLLTPVAFVASTFLVVQVYQQTSGALEREADVSQYLLADGKAFVGEGLELSRTDSIKIEAYRNHIMFDTAHLNMEFLNRLSVHKANFFEQYMNHSWKLYMREAIDRMVMAGSDMGSNMAFYFLSVLSIVVLVIRHRDYHLLGKVLPVNAAFFGLLLTISYFIKMEYYIFSPLINILAMVNFAYLAFFRGENPSSWALVLSLLVVLPFKLPATIREAGQLKITDGEMAENMRLVNEISQDRYLWLDETSSSVCNIDALHQERFSGQRAIILYDMCQAPLVKQFRMHHDAICGCNSLDPTAFFNFLDSHRDEVVFVSSRKRLDIVFGYMRDMNGFNNMPVLMESGRSFNNDHLQLPGEYRMGFYMFKE